MKRFALFNAAKGVYVHYDFECCQPYEICSANLTANDCYSTYDSAMNGINDIIFHTLRADGWTDLDFDSPSRNKDALDLRDNIIIKELEFSYSSSDIDGMDRNMITRNLFGQIVESIMVGDDKLEKFVTSLNVSNKKSKFYVGEFIPDIVKIYFDFSILKTKQKPELIFLAYYHPEETIDQAGISEYEFIEDIMKTTLFYSEEEANMFRLCLPDDVAEHFIITGDGVVKFVDLVIEKHPAIKDYFKEYLD